MCPHLGKVEVDHVVLLMLLEEVVHGGHLQRLVLIHLVHQGLGDVALEVHHGEVGHLRARPRGVEGVDQPRRRDTGGPDIALWQLEGGDDSDEQPMYTTV